MRVSVCLCVCPSRFSCTRDNSSQEIAITLKFYRSIVFSMLIQEKNTRNSELFYFWCYTPSSLKILLAVTLYHEYTVKNRKSTISSF